MICLDSKDWGQYQPSAAGSGADAVQPPLGSWQGRMRVLHLPLWSCSIGWQLCNHCLHSGSGLCWQPL